jgi:hypothetical protein
MEHRRIIIVTSTLGLRFKGWSCPSRKQGEHVQDVILGYATVYKRTCLLSLWLVSLLITSIHQYKNQSHTLQTTTTTTNTMADNFRQTPSDKIMVSR